MLSRTYKHDTSYHTNKLKIFYTMNRKKNIQKGIVLAFTLLSLISMQAQSMGVKLSSGEVPNTILDVNGSVAVREGSPLSMGNGTNNNVAIDSMSFYQITAPTAVFTITGLTNGVNGRLLTLFNRTNYTMTLKHQNTSSTAANRINTGGSDVTVAANGVVSLYYSTNLSNWILTSSQGVPSPAWDLAGNTGTTAGTNFVGTRDAQDLVFKTNNTEGVRLTSSQNLAIGTSTALNRLTVSGNANISQHLAVGANAIVDDGSLLWSGSSFKNTVSVAEEMSGVFSENYRQNISNHLKINASNNPTTEIIALDSEVEIKTGNASNYPFVGGTFGTVKHRGTGTITNQYGFAGYSQNLSSGILTNAVGLFAEPSNKSTGNITNAVGLSTLPINNTSTGTVTNAYGILINKAVNASSGLVRNNYGLYVSDLSGVGSDSSFNIYSGGCTAKNYFCGIVGIGLLTPTYPLDVYASSNPVRIQGLQTGSASDNLMSINSLGIVRTISQNSYWSTVGNSGTSSGTNFIGTTDAQNLAFRTNNTEGVVLTTSQNLGIGTSTPNTKLDVDGGLSMRPSTTVSLTANNQAVTVGNRSFLVLSSDNATASNRVFTLSNGLQSGQVLVVLLTTNAAQLADSGNCNLASTYAMTANDTISLIWNGATWYETGRSVN